MVEATLAEAELKAQHAAAAEAAANKAIQADPASAEALILKGRAIEERAREGDWDQRKGLFDEARRLFIAANKLDTEDPEPLYEYYWSYLRQGTRPTDNAVAGLHYASDLAPQDIGVRMNSAIAYLEDGKPKDARAALVVVAYAPHASNAAEVAKRMMADIDAGDPKAALMETRRPSSSAAGSR
jgi:Flp pilus assembly protein TadD